MKNQYMPKKALLAKKHEQALVKKIAVILVFCMAGIILVIYFAIPAMVKIADVWDTTRNSNVPNNSVNGIDIPLQRPTFNSLPFDATNSATLTISGRAEPGLAVHLIFNGTEKTNVVADNQGSFTFANIGMNEGINSFSGYSQNDKGKKSSPTQTYTVTLDTSVPKIEVSSPNAGDTFGGASQSVVEVKGKTDEATEVYINGSRGILNADGSFSQKVQLQGGENTLTLYAKDNAGNKSVDVSRKVTYNP
jgi:hypothetical protein